MPKSTTPNSAADVIADAEEPPPAAAAAREPRNEVILCGRVSVLPDERELPSGDTILTTRLIVDRDAAARRRSSQRVDTFDLVAWTARVQRGMRGWKPGDVVTVEGSVRRRFFRGAAGPASRVEVEVRAARRHQSG